MPPEEEDQQNRDANDEAEATSGVQSLFIIRHGDRWDYENPEVRVKA